MTKAAFALNPDNLPHRMTAAQVCELAGCSATTLWRRRRLDPTWLPAAPVQLGKSTMFDRAAVLVALCLAQDAPEFPPIALYLSEDGLIHHREAS